LTRIVRAALTQTVNAYGEMPASLEALDALTAKLEAIRDANVEHHVALIERAASQGAQVIGLGELFTGPYFALERRPFWRGLAECATTGRTVSRLREVARAQHIVIVAPIYEEDGEKRFNTAVFIDADGALLGRYRKTHIPSGQNEQGEFDERFYYQESDGAPQPAGLRTQGRWRKSPDMRHFPPNTFFPVFESAVGKLGAAICFDRHFEGVMSSLSREGAELVFSPAVTFGAKSERLWHMEFQTDATRHRVFIGGSNRKGSEPPWNVEYFGASHFVSPDGPCPDLSDHPDLVISDLDLGTLAGVDPAGWDLQANRRSSIYTGES